MRIGLDASLLPQVCEVWLRARDAKALTKIQLPVADRANIIAIVDEVTGYQRDRAKDALAGPSRQISATHSTSLLFRAITSPLPPSPHFKPAFCYSIVGRVGPQMGGGTSE